MSNWKSPLAWSARKLGLAKVPHKPSTDHSAFIQPLELIPGMAAAPEPCMHPARWSEARHPRGRTYAQLKADGIRALFLRTRVLSRQSLPLDCALHCLTGLVQLEERYGQPMVFDGEYVEPEGFNATLAAHKRGEGMGTIHLFDAVPYAEWRANRFTERLEDRVPRLVDHVAAMGHTFIEPLPLIPVESAEHAQQLAAGFWSQAQEGIVVKRGASLYQRGESNDWLKLKRTHTYDGEIFDCVVVDGRCKAILVRIGDKNVRVGSAIPEALRVEIGADPERWTGRYVEIGFTDRTDSGALRGGYFVRPRPDKDGSL
ncbi:MAG: hypothetical protein ABW128_07105 [Rhizorhabdus sp.]